MSKLKTQQQSLCNHNAKGTLY